MESYLTTWMAVLADGSAAEVSCIEFDGDPAPIKLIAVTRSVVFTPA